MARLPLRANFSWTLVGNLVSAACQWGVVVVLSKLGTPEIVGQFALGFALTAPIMMFANLGLRGVQVTDAKDVYSFRDYLGLRLITTALALVAIAGITLGTGYRLEKALVILAVGSTKACEAVTDAFHGLLQKHERMDRIAQSVVFKALASLLVFSAVLLITHRLLWAVLSQTVVTVLRFVTFDVPNALMILAPQWKTGPNWWRVEARSWTASLRPRWDRRKLASLAYLAMPLGVTAMLISLNTNIPRYIIERHLGERELGLYAALSYLIVAGDTVVSALGACASPRLAKHYANGEVGAFRRLLLRLVGVGALMGLAAVLVALVAGERLLTLLYSPEYAMHTDVFVWLMVAAAASYVASFLGYAMTAAHYYMIQPVNLVVCAIISALLCVILVPAYGLVGAAWALAASFGAYGIAGALCSAHALRRRGAPQGTT